MLIPGPFLSSPLEKPCYNIKMKIEERLVVFPSTPSATERNRDNMSKMTFKDVRGVGHLASLLLTTPVNPTAPLAEQKRMSNEDILAQLRLAYPNRRPTTHTLAWYISRLNNDAAYRAKHGGKEPLAAPSKAAKTVEVTIEVPATPVAVPAKK